MVRTALIIILLLVLAGLVQTGMAQSASTNVPSAWRAAFRAADTDEGMRAFRGTMSAAVEAHPGHPGALGFQAVAELLHDVGHWSPLAKWLGFRKWTGELEKQLGLAPGHPDLVFLRLTVQDGSPAFLGYGGDMISDCAAVSAALAAGFWADDPVHQSFVERIQSGIDECR